MTDELLTEFYNQMVEDGVPYMSATDPLGNDVEIGKDKDWLFDKDNQEEIEQYIEEFLEYTYNTTFANTGLGAYGYEDMEDILNMYSDNPDARKAVIAEYVKKFVDEIDSERTYQNEKNLMAALEDEITEQNTEALLHLSAWDPRISRLDTFYMGIKEDVGVSGAKIIVPFASDTAATAFFDMVYTLPAKVAKKAFEASNKDVPTAIALAASSGEHNWDSVPMLNDDTLRQYTTDGKLWGASSLMNPYSLTKLVGSFEAPSGNNTIPQNYMYDIRDQRRFYSFTRADNDLSSITQVASPTVTQIIEWSNKDIWGRTPYSFLDFVYCKWFGTIPNNRLITLRRYHAPTRDNLQFELMLGEDDGPTTPTKTGTDGRTTTFSPRCTVISYIGAETGNTFGDFLKFSTGINWDEAVADLWEVSGEDGSDPLAVIDQMFEGNGFGGADNNAFDKLLNVGSNITNRILSFGKMATAINGKVTLTEGAQMKLLSANMDPYNNIYSNRIKGPLDRITAVKKRKEGIIFDSAYTVTCTYVTKSIGGINPKAAMLDILANCMEMVSPTAIFWGGGHRFMITPHMYPFHDGGWRDSFMKKLYDGKIFGDNGAIATVLKGVKDFGTGDNGGFDWSNITSKLGGMLGAGLACISSLVSTVTTALFGEGTNVLSNILDKGAEAASGKTGPDLKQMANNVFNNLNTMWHSKVLATTVAPRIEGMNAILIGDPVGEWHLTVGNPLNPIIVVGNLICEKMEVSFNEELGPDDFPTELKVVYSLLHGMLRDKKAIQSMFNRGMGSIYELPDYIKSSSERETHVDKFTGGSNFRTPGYMHTNTIKAKAGVSGSTYLAVKLSEPIDLPISGNPNTLLITKFNRSALSQASLTLGAIQTNNFLNNSNITAIRALGITRKFTT